MPEIHRTITISEETNAAIQRWSEDLHLTPNEIIASLVAERLNTFDEAGMVLGCRHDVWQTLVRIPLSNRFRSEPTRLPRRR